jgi:hypothetical protein
MARSFLHIGCVVQFAVSFVPGLDHFIEWCLLCGVWCVVTFAFTTLIFAVGPFRSTVTPLVLTELKEILFCLLTLGSLSFNPLDSMSPKHIIFITNDAFLVGVSLFSCMSCIFHSSFV